MRGHSIYLVLNLAFTSDDGILLNVCFDFKPTGNSLPKTIITLPITSVVRDEIPLASIN